MCLRHALAQRLHFYLQHLLLLTYAIFLLGFFVIPNAVDHYKFFSVAVMVPAILLLPVAWASLQGSDSRSLFLLILFYLVYMVITALWSESFDSVKFFGYLRLALYIAIFLLVPLMLAREMPDKLDLLLRFTCVAVAVAAIISLVLWYQDHPFPRSRVVGIGTMEHPNASAMVYGIFAVMSAGYALASRQWAARLSFILLSFILISFVWFSQSRGTLLASVAAMAVLVLLHGPRKAMVIGLLAGGGLGVLFLAFPDLVQTAISRGLTSRPELWEIILGKVSQAPFFGHGYLSNEFVYVPREDKLLFAHNAYLASLRDGGIVGLGLMLAMLASAILLAYRQGKESSNHVLLAMLVYGMTIMLFDTDRLLTRPRELWLALWFPLALIMSRGMLCGVHPGRDRYTGSQR